MKPVIAFLYDPKLCPYCFRETIEYSNVFNKLCPVEEVEEGQKYYAHCEACGKNFHILWEKNKFCPVDKDSFMKEFVDDYLEHKPRREG